VVGIRNKVKDDVASGFMPDVRLAYEIFFHEKKEVSCCYFFKI